MTLALVALLSAIAVPSLISSWHASTLGAGAFELAGAVNGARQLAISLNAPVCVAVAGAVLRLEGVSGIACTGVPLPGAGPVVSLSSGLVVESAGPNIVFTGLGAAIPSGSYTMVHPVTGARRRVVVAASGRVSVQ